MHTHMLAVTYTHTHTHTHTHTQVCTYNSLNSHKKFTSLRKAYAYIFKPYTQHAHKLTLNALTNGYTLTLTNQQVYLV